MGKPEWYIEGIRKNHGIELVINSKPRHPTIIDNAQGRHLSGGLRTKKEVSLWLDGFYAALGEIGLEEEENG